MTDQKTDMTLRDHFADQAMRAMLRDISEVADTARHLKMHPAKLLAKNAYEIADAMMEAREKSSD